MFRCRMDGLGRRTARLSDIVSVRDAMANPKAKPPRFEVLSSPVNGYTTLELFAGAGGTALGLANAGFFHLMLNEFDADACRTLRANRPQWNVVEEDVHDLSFEPYKGHVEELRTRGGPDLSVNVYHLDMADPEACRDMFRKALRWLS